MKLSHFSFKLPDELLAEYPSEHRDEARLMVLNREKQTIEHKHFKDLIDYFEEDDVMILNNTKVFPARLFGNKEKTGARIEVFLLRELNSEQRLWDVLVDPARKNYVFKFKRFFFLPSDKRKHSSEYVSNMTRENLLLKQKTINIGSLLLLL